MVTRLDRLARSTRDLLNILDTIAKAGACFKSERALRAAFEAPAPQLRISSSLMLMVRLMSKFAFAPVV
jgi:DNA invertase Pin-like site-specific DNA recombinase